MDRAPYSDHWFKDVFPIFTGYHLQAGPSGMPSKGYLITLSGHQLLSMSIIQGHGHLPVAFLPWYKGVLDRLTLLMDHSVSSYIVVLVKAVWEGKANPY